MPGLLGEPHFARNQLERGEVPLPLNNLKKERLLGEPLSDLEVEGLGKMGVGT